MAPSAAGGPLPESQRNGTSPTAQQQPNGLRDGARPAAGDGSSAAANAPSSISEVVASITADDFAKVTQTPCARNGLLVGIGAGVGIGGLNFSLRGNIRKSSNLAVGLFLVGSMASYEYCQFKRRGERTALKREIEVVGARKREEMLERKKKIEDERREQQQRLEDERRAQAEQRRGWRARWGSLW